ncbi:MAG TPA: GNAT family N-acetyltransferase [Candidatus Dormibacteraeota bacterium]|nr:GNAT family N-acetyltransferase [Candidatus Dormibacteraeota bacterium]
MIKSPEPASSVPVQERRVHPRLWVGSCASVDLGEGKSGTVLNLGEGGLALRVSVALVELLHISPIRFGLAISDNRLEINGQMAWVSESKTEVGIRFVDLLEDTRGKIRDWISLKSSQEKFQKESELHGEGHRLSSPASGGHLREIRLDQDLGAFRKGWKECNSRFHDHTIHCDPDWIEEQYKGQKENVRIYFLERESQIIGAVPFVLSRESLPCSLGESIVAKFPLHVLSLQGYAPNMPAETSVYDMLFSRILESEFDAIKLSHVKTASFLWSYLHSSPLIQKFFSFYTPSGPLPHPLIRLNGSFADYMNQFSSKARKNRLREMKKLQARGNVQLIRVTKASEIDAFLKVAYRISQKTWQFVRYRVGIGARDVDAVRSELEFLAQRGWLRAYLLTCDAMPCAFIIGQQYGLSFYTSAAGVDSSWRSYSAGTVLFLLVLEDLFREDSPQYYDLDDYVRYKEQFANESYLEAVVWLFRRRMYPLLASSIYRTCNATSKTAAAALDRLHLKSRIKQLIWG